MPDSSHDRRWPDETQAGPQHELRMSHVGLTYDGQSEPALTNFSLTVRRGERISVVGPSGSGKSTILLIAGGHLEPTSGSVWINGADVTKLPARSRGVRSMFQSLALFPHMTVAENIAFPLRMARIDKRTAAREVDRILEAVHLRGFAPRRIQTLSGGQRQRVALARAMVSDPKAVLLDEPLAPLDRTLRRELLDFLVEFFRDRKTPVILVGHDQEEALAFGTSVLVLESGQTAQFGEAEELLEKPATAFVAEFLGAHNVFRGHLQSDGVFVSQELLLPLGRVDVAFPVAAIGIKPASLRFGETGPLRCTALYSRRDADRLKLRARLDDGRPIDAHLHWADKPLIRGGESISLGFDPRDVLLLPE